MTKLALDLDGALGDTRPLWREWLARSERVLGVDPHALPEDRAAAAAALDQAEAGNWRTLLRRFADDHAPVYLRPAADVSAALRRLERGGATLGVFTDAPAELADVALAHLGARRRVQAVEAGAGARERLLERLGEGTEIVRTRAALLAHAAAVRR